MNSGEWKHDPRLAGMDPVKLQYIEKIAAQVSSQSKTEIMPTLLSLQAEARKNNISFTDQETALLISLITKQTLNKGGTLNENSEHQRRRIIL